MIFVAANPEIPVIPEPKYRELDKVRVVFPDAGEMVGFVIDSQWDAERNFHVYEISLSETDQDADTFDNWAAEDWMERVP